MVHIRKLIRNPLVLLGVGILFLTGLVGVLVDIPLAAYVAQSSLPALVGGLLLAYGWYIRQEVTQSLRRTIFIWIGCGLLSFFLVGFYFGFLSRRFDTSFLLAVVASLSVGAALGALIGIYAGRLQRTNTELVAEKERLQQFAGVISHDLRNPLSATRGQVALLDDEVDSDRLASIEQSLDRMDTLIDDVLTLVRQDQHITEIETADLETLTRQCWQTVDTGDATLVVDTTADLRCDPSRFQQLLENLIRNAVEHGGEDVTLTVGELEECSGIYIADDGPGIPAEDRSRIFDDGFSTAGTGTGLGLAIVERIVEGHDWEISVTDSADGGARFEITGVDLGES